jgi:hypothetical protein
MNRLNRVCRAITEWYRAHRKLYCAIRVFLWIALIGVVMYTIHPKGSFNPESNFLLGPLWLLTYQSVPASAFVIFMSNVALFIPVGIRFNAITIAIFVLGICIWIAIGIALAMNAVA